MANNHAKKNEIIIQSQGLSARWAITGSEGARYDIMQMQNYSWIEQQNASYLKISKYCWFCLVFPINCTWIDYCIENMVWKD